MTFDELYAFMCNFIATHPELAEKNKAKREQMLMKQSEEETLTNCRKLAINLKK